MLDSNQFATLLQTQPHERTSDRYSFISTKRVLDLLAEDKWFPAKVQEANARRVDYRGYQKHIVRLRRADNLSSEMLKVGDSIPEIVVINSHMGSAAFHFMLGIFRLVCTNGMITGESFSRFSVRHTGYTDKAVENAVQNLVRLAPRALENVERFKAIELTPPEQTAFAQSVIELVNDGQKFAMQPYDLLRTRRFEDNKSDLWTTFNRVQENVIKGGISRTTTDGRSRRTREVKSIDRNVDLNRALWSLTEKMAELKANQ